MRVRIHRGSHEVGGSCIELEHGGARLVLDLGLPLSTARGEVPPLPPIPGLARPDSSLLGVLLTHVHADHCGLAHHVGPDVPIGVSPRANMILRAASRFSPWARAFESPRWSLEDGRMLEIGPFRVTPLLVDHSAFDAFALLVEAAGRRLLYTGDLRAHGWKGRLFGAIPHRLPGPPHALLLEGTHVRADAPDTPGPTERDVVERCAALFRVTRGLGLAVHSAQNVDRLVSLWKAARAARRELAIDLYTAAVAEACGRTSIPRPGFPGVAVYVPEWQRRAIRRGGDFAVVNRVRDLRVFGDREFLAEPARWVVAAGEHAVTDLDRDGLLREATVVWSMWKGYLDAPGKLDLRALVASRGGRFEIVHSSGHAYVEDLQALARAVAPVRVVPIHTFAPERFMALFDRVTLERDGDWWEV